MFSQKIEGGYTIREVTSAELTPCLETHFKAVFQNRIESSVPTNIDEKQKMQIAERKKADQRYWLRLGVFFNDEMIGWHYGYATDAESYYMQNSAILESFRGRGLYSHLLTATLSKLTEEGFQVITSTHHANNAAVLIPKLKQGFIITGTQFHERFKFLVELKYFSNAERRKAYGKNMGLEL